MTHDATVRDFDLIKSLEVFVSVADTGSMTAAAGRLRITQSAISQQIKILETDFGAPLFYRDVPGRCAATSGRPPLAACPICGSQSFRPSRANWRQPFCEP